MDLLERMGRIVEKKVKNYKSDFYDSDTDKIKREARKGTRFYWLLRENGTWLEREDEILVDSDYWNKETFFSHYAEEGIKCELYLITISSLPTEEPQGKIKKLNFPEYLENFKEKKTPKLYTIQYEDREYTRKWDPSNPPTVESCTEFIKQQGILDIDFVSEELVVRFVF